MTKLTRLLCGFLLSATTSSGLASDFLGWQAFRVIEQDGRPDRLRSADVDGDGRDEIIVVNPRFSRLEIYRWLPRDERVATGTLERERRRANELPMAAELQRHEIQLEQLPRDVIVADVDDDGQPELVVLVAPPSRIVILERNEDDDDGNGKHWTEKSRIDLLEGDLSSRDDSMLIREAVSGTPEILISFSEGIQSLELSDSGRPKWLRPREKLDRSAWWLADLDRDGDLDLVEQTRKASASVRWYPCSEKGELLPAQILFERPIGGAEVLSSPDACQLAIIDNTGGGIVRRYRLGDGEPSELGRTETVALPADKDTPWCGMQLGEHRALVVADPDRPQLLSYRLTPEGWQDEESYPGLSNIVSMAAPGAAPNQLLLRTKESTDLFVSRWNDQRLTYPKIWPMSPDVEDREILALSQVSEKTWWVQRVGSDIDLYVWSPTNDAEGTETSEPAKTRFPKAGKTIAEALWIGGERLLVKNKHARGLRLIELKDGKTESVELAHLKKAGLEEFRLFEVAGGLKLARFVDGVLQWLDDDLQSFEQIMLPDGQQMASYVSLGDSTGWGLENDSAYIHQLAADDAGVVRSTKRIKVATGQRLVHDAHLGLLLVNRDRITHLGQGTPKRLELLGTLDKRIGREDGIRETRMHRINSEDLDGDGVAELLLFDDTDHRITALTGSGEQLLSLLTWQVFDDKIYPYGDDQSNRVREPRAICSLDVDGDDQPDLAMLCHDRLIIYLGRGE